MDFKICLLRIVSVFLTVMVVFGTVTGVSVASAEIKSMDERRAEKQASAEELVDNMVEIARAEEGYYESYINKFTLWYYGLDTESSWCTIFVSWCAAQAGAIGTAVPRRNTCSSMRRWFERRGEYHTTDSGYIPQKGDIAFLNTASDGTDDVHHVEIVTEDGFFVINGKNYIKAVGGNTSDINYNGSEYVTEKTRPVISERAVVVGFANPSYEKSVGVRGDIHTSTQKNMTAYARYLYAKVIAMIYNTEVFWANFAALFTSIGKPEEVPSEETVAIAENAVLAENIVTE